MAYNDQQFDAGGIRENVALASSVAAAGNYPAANGVTIYGGDYICRVTASAWNSATAKLQFLDADGTTYSDVTAANGSALTPFSANGQLALGFASNSRVRLAVTGTPAGLNARLDRIP